MAVRGLAGEFSVYLSIKNALLDDSFFPGGTVDQREADTVLHPAFENGRGWFLSPSSADRLELCVRQCRLRQEQDDLFDGDHHGCSVHRPRHLCPSQGQKRRGKGSSLCPP